MNKKLKQEIKDELWDYIIDIEFIMSLSDVAEIDENHYNSKMNKLYKLVNILKKELKE